MSLKFQQITVIVKPEKLVIPLRHHTSAEILVFCAASQFPVAAAPVACSVRCPAPSPFPALLLVGAPCHHLPTNLLVLDSLSLGLLLVGPNLRLDHRTVFL